MALKPDNLNLNLNLNLGAAAAGAGAPAGRIRFNTEDFPTLARLPPVPAPVPPGDDLLAAVPTFGHRIDWDPESRAWLHLVEFVAEIPQAGPFDPNKGTFAQWLPRVETHLDTAGGAPPIKCPAGPHVPKLTLAQLQVEINDMVDAALDRGDRLQEIVDQADGEGAINYWTGMLALNPATQPNTHLLIRVGRKIGELVVMVLKDYYTCPRPSRIFPLIVPAIDPPDTPSYPSGHATQAYLISGLLAAAIDPGGGVQPAHLKDNTLRRALKRLADRIADNRVIAGLHYPIDGRAGEVVATWCLRRALLCPSMPALIAAVAAENP